MLEIRHDLFIFFCHVVISETVQKPVGKQEADLTFIGRSVFFCLFLRVVDIDENITEVCVFFLNEAFRVADSETDDVSCPVDSAVFTVDLADRYGTHKCDGDLKIIFQIKYLFSIARDPAEHFVPGQDVFICSVH